MLLRGSGSSLYPPPPGYACNDDGTKAEMRPPMIPKERARAFGEVTPVPSGGPQQPVLGNVREIDSDGIAEASSSSSSSLVAFNAELLLVYIDVFHTLCTSPSAYARKVENLQVLIWNMKHRLRRLREAQSYASLTTIFREATASRRQAAIDARRARADAKEIVYQLAHDVEKAVNDTDGDASDEEMLHTKNEDE